MTSCRTRRNLISGWWALIRGTPRISERNYRGAGFEVEPFPQTYLRFSPAAKSFEVFVNRRVIVHRGDPVLSWSMSNVVMQSDANANIKPNKKKITEQDRPERGGADGVWYIPGRA